MLFIIATPIGNLQDITHRALSSFKECDYLLCEDTRRTRILLNHYEIQVPLKSFHLFNEKARQNRVLLDLKEGKTIGLVSDAGTPGIADPGEKLIQACIHLEIPVEVVPGPCAAIAALVASGFVTSRFQFLGFLPRRKGKIKKILIEACQYPGTTICYESPYRILPTLEILKTLDPHHQCVLAKELTKKFEKWVRGDAETVYKTCTETGLKGEFVLLIEGLRDK